MLAQVTFLPADLLETVRRVVTPRVVRPGTASTSIQNETLRSTKVNRYCLKSDKYKLTLTVIIDLA
jgi:hypothetical protein